MRKTYMYLFFFFFSENKHVFFATGLRDPDYMYIQLYAPRGNGTLVAEYPFTKAHRIHVKAT